jgi:hypothetical protein
MKRTKNLVLFGIQLLVVNNLLNFVSTFANLALAWDALHCKFALGNQSHLFMLMNQLHIFKMSKRRSMEEYVNKTMDLNISSWRGSPKQIYLSTCIRWIAKKL